MRTPTAAEVRYVKAHSKPPLYSAKDQGLTKIISGIFFLFSIISLWPLSKDSVKSAIIFLILAGACQYPLYYKRKRNREYEEQIPNGQFLVQNVKAVKLVNSGVYGIRTRVRNLNGEKLKGIAGIPMAEASKLLKQSQRKGVSIRRWAERPICVA